MSWTSSPTPALKLTARSLPPCLISLACRFAGLICCLSLSTWGCGGQPQRQGKSKAEAIYLQGMDALSDEDYLTATDRFRAVKTKYLFSPYAALSELRLGDTAFAQTRYYEAIETFRLFIQSRPNHAEVPYAYWKIGAAYAAQRPSDFFLLPPAHERDRGPTKDALRALQNYLDRYPEHKRAKEAQTLVKLCRQELGEYELYVARFYRHGQKWEAARGRYEILIERFKDQDELWRAGAEELVEIYQHLDLTQKATQLKTQLKSRSQSSEE